MKRTNQNKQVQASSKHFSYEQPLFRNLLNIRIASNRIEKFGKFKIYIECIKIIEKISQSHLFFYSWFKFHQYKNISLTREHYHVDAFRILPRTGDWAHTSCVFEIDHKAVENKFFLMKPENREEVSLDNFKFYSEIKPTLDQLRHFGLLDKTCLAIDAFPSAL